MKRIPFFALVAIAYSCGQISNAHAFTANATALFRTITAKALSAPTPYKALGIGACALGAFLKLRSNGSLVRFFPTLPVELNAEERESYKSSMVTCEQQLHLRSLIATSTRALEKSRWFFCCKPEHLVLFPFQEFLRIFKFHATPGIKMDPAALIHYLNNDVLTTSNDHYKKDHINGLVTLIKAYETRFNLVV